MLSGGSLGHERSTYWPFTTLVWPSPLGGLPVAETIWKQVLNPCMSLGRAGEGHLDRMAMPQVVRWLRHPRSLIGGGVHSPSLWASSYLDTCLADVTEVRVDKLCHFRADNGRVRNPSEVNNALGLLKLRAKMHPVHTGRVVSENKIGF